MGSEGLDEYQIVTGAVRTRCAAAFTFTADSEASGTTTLNDIYTGTALQHVLYSLSIADGKALAFYFKNCRPTRFVTAEALDGLNRETISFEALTGPTTTTEETMASFVLGMG